MERNSKFTYPKSTRSIINGSRHYLIDNSRLPSVTSILSATKSDEDKAGIADEWYSKLNFVHPGKEGPTALDGVSDVAWKENRDMSGELLSKVKRQNKIMIEFKGLSTISRTD